MLTYFYIIIVVCPYHICLSLIVLSYILTTRVLWFGFLVLGQSSFTFIIKQYRWFARSDQFLSITLSAISFRIALKTQMSLQFPLSNSQYKLNLLSEMVQLPINGFCIHTIDTSKRKAVFSVEIIYSYSLSQFYYITNINNLRYSLYFCCYGSKKVFLLGFLPYLYLYLLLGHLL